MEKVLDLQTVDEQRALFGPRDRFLRLVRDRYRVRVVARHGRLCIEGPDDRVRAAHGALRQLLEKVRRFGALEEGDVQEAVAEQPASTPTAGADGAKSVMRERAGFAPRPDARGRHGRARAREVTPMTAGQARYIQAIVDHECVFAIGPAGTGKTFLATAMAVDALNQGLVNKLVLVRPAVEAGEKLGYLPGDYQAKINPYLRPIFDALGALLEFGTLKRYMDRDVIEVAPLAYMRGRTLESAFIILDEAQNTTPKQMHMFLTRFGRHSRVVVTGDITQVDLEGGQVSGLIDALRILKRVPGIGFVELTDDDIVRHALVTRIVNAYEAADRQRNGTPRAETHNNRE